MISNSASLEGSVPPVQLLQSNDNDSNSASPIANRLAQTYLNGASESPKVSRSDSFVSISEVSNEKRMPLYVMFVPKDNRERATESLAHFNDITTYRRPASHSDSNSGLSSVQASDKWHQVEVHDLSDISMVKLSRHVQTEGKVPGVASEQLLTMPQPDYFSRLVERG